MTFDKIPPLNFFDTLLEPDGYNICKNKTISSIEESAKGYLESVDYNKGEIRFWHFDHDEAKTELTTYNFEKELPKKIKKEITKAKTCIDSIALEISKKGDNPKEFLENQVKHIYLLLNKSISDNSIYELNLLDKLASYLIDRYSLNSKNKLKRIKKVSTISYFDLKADVKLSQLEAIYDVAIDLEIFNDEVVMEDTFISVLSGNPIDSDENIIFKCNNQLSVLFIDCIQPLFNNFTYSQIGKSRSFYNKAHKILNQDDLNTAKNRLTKKSSQSTDKVCSIINNIVASS